MDATSGVLGDILITAVTSKAYWASKTTELFGVDLRSLAFLRVSLAIIVLLDLAYRANDLKAHYTDLGILPRSALMSGAGNEWNISIHNISGLLEIQVALFAIHGLVAVALMAGYRTQVATILVWFFAISLQSRNPMILTGGDNLLALLLFWSMFLPMGARFSVDSALNNGPHRESNRYLSTATAAVLLQVGMVYIFTAIMKSDPIWREDFSAVYYALSIDQLATGLGHYLLNYPDILAVMTAATLWTEFAGPALAFSPFFNGPIRLVVILAFIALHIGIALTLNIGFFPVVSIIGLIVFVPGLFWDTLFSRLAVPSRTGLKIYYDGECNFCWKIVSLMRTFLLVPGVQTYPAQGDTLANEIFQNNNSWVVIDHNGTTHIGFPALIYVLKSSPLFWPVAMLLCIPPIPWAGKRLYRLTAEHRTVFSRLTAFLRFRPLKVDLPAWAQALAVLFLAFIIYWNIALVQHVSVPRQISWVGPMFRVYQNWGLFAPYPLLDDGWYVIPGKLRSGQEIDVYQDGAQVTWTKPEHVANTYDNNRWRKYMMNIWKIKYSQQRLYYGKYLCREWNNNIQDGQQLETFDIYFVLETTLPNYQKPELERVRLWSHYCFAPK